MPQPPTKRDIQLLITDATRQRLSMELTDEMRKAPDSRKARRALQQRICREELLKYGVSVSDEGIVATVENDAESDSNPPADRVEGEDGDAADAGPGISAQKGRLIFDRDDSAQPVDIPQKWMRLQIEMTPFEFRLEEPGNIETLASNWSQRLACGGHWRCNGPGDRTTALAGHLEWMAGLFRFARIGGSRKERPFPLRRRLPRLPAQQRSLPTMPAITLWRVGGPWGCPFGTRALSGWSAIRLNARRCFCHHSFG